MRFLAVAIVLAIICIGLYVRLAPQNAERWHTSITEKSDTDYEGGAVRVLQAMPEILSKADAYMLTLPRTETLAGSVEQGRVTYVTRSRFWGFPDYTTIEVDNGQLRAYARLRFGKSDLGVNRKRLEGLLSAIQ